MTLANKTTQIAQILIKEDSNLLETQVTSVNAGIRNTPSSINLKNNINLFVTDLLFLHHSNPTKLERETENFN